MIVGEAPKDAADCVGGIALVELKPAEDLMVVSDEILVWHVEDLIRVFDRVLLWHVSPSRNPGLSP